MEQQYGSAGKQNFTKKIWRQVGYSTQLILTIELNKLILTGLKSN
jgi:hypothetical protein